MIDVGFAELHGSIFVNGKNLTTKLDTHHNKALVMKYDAEEKELLVTWNGVTSHIPSTNIMHYIPGPAVDRKITQSSAPVTFNAPVRAQVESPMSHVHAGPGHGQTGLAGKIK